MQFQFFQIPLIITKPNKSSTRCNPYEIFCLSSLRVHVIFIFNAHTTFSIKQLEQKECPRNAIIFYFAYCIFIYFPI